MDNISTIIQELKKFRDERDWEQFHNSKDLALAINIEAGELLELFLWKKAEEANVEKVKEELADIFSFAFLLADKYDFDVKQIILDFPMKSGIFRMQRRGKMADSDPRLQLLLVKTSYGWQTSL